MEGKKLERIYSVTLTQLKFRLNLKQNLMHQENNAKRTKALIL